ncbi:potassium/sodium hyperpolarization-activated cyclic nucleotide-gated channel 2-like [Zophobas morio]
MLPADHPLAPLSRRLKRFVKKQILVSEYNPQTSIFFLTSAIIVEEKKRQIESGSWIVHPFSVFRIYYEMWMTFVFLANLIFIPIDAAYGFLLESNQIIDFVLGSFCLFDIFMNFLTGYCLPSHEVEMNPRKIAKHYVFGVYFICDLLSSLPIDIFTDYKAVDDNVSLLKIVRLGTLLKYMGRSFHFYKIKSFYILLVTAILLIVHYMNCLFFYLPLFVMRFTHTSEGRDDFILRRVGSLVPNTTLGYRWYVVNWYHSTSFLLSVELKYGFSWPPVTYLSIILFYIFGKVFMAGVTVMLLERYRLYKGVETKFYSMMSQVNAFMEIHKFPRKLQAKVHQYYKYKYKKKYFNESRVDRNISEKLRREIRYHQLRTLVKNVTIFEAIPQEFLENLFVHLKKEIYLPQDVIISAGVAGDCMFFIYSGTVAVFSPSGKEICHLTDGDYFGEITLILPNRKTTASIIALEICEVYRLDRKPFRKCLEKQENLYNKIQEVAKRRLNESHQIDRIQILVTPGSPNL